MTHEEVLQHAPVKINTLYSLENISDCYELRGYDIVNATTNHVKTLNYLYHKYPYVTLNEKGTNKQKKVTLHKILALAYLHNGPYDIVEHLDDNPRNFHIENLLISNHSDNGKRAFVNGHGNRTEKIYRVIMHNGEEYVGTMKELSNRLNIPRQTIYGRFYLQTPGKEILNVTLI